MNVKIVKSPVETAQAVKNEVEIQGFRNAYLRDGAAWVHRAEFASPAKYVTDVAPAGSLASMAGRAARAREGGDGMGRWREANELPGGRAVLRWGASAFFSPLGLLG